MEEAFSFLFYLNMIDAKVVENIVEDYLIDKPDLFLVSVKVSPKNEIVVELDSFNGLGIDDCITLNKEIESKLDREVEDYELEVGSAGLTSPFKITKQYEKYRNQPVEVLLKDGLKYEGILIDNDDEGFSIEVENKVKLEGAKRKTTVQEVLKFSFEQVKYTKYQITIK